MRHSLVVAAAALLALATPASAADLTTAQWHSVIAIHDAARVYGVSEAFLDGVAWCESGMTPNAYNAASGAYGLFQFEYPTWAEQANALDQWKGRQNAWASAYEAARLIREGESWRWDCA